MTERSASKTINQKRCENLKSPMKTNIFEKSYFRSSISVIRMVALIQKFQSTISEYSNRKIHLTHRMIYFECGTIVLWGVRRRKCFGKRLLNLTARKFVSQTVDAFHKEKFVEFSFNWLNEQKEETIVSFSNTINRSNNKVDESLTVRLELEETKFYRDCSTRSIKIETKKTKRKTYTE